MFAATATPSPAGGGDLTPPEWLPEGAVAHSNFITDLHYADGEEQTLEDLWSGATVDANGLQSIATAVGDMLAALQGLPFSIVVSSGTGGQGNLYGAATDYVDGAYYVTSNTSLSTDDFDSAYLDSGYPPGGDLYNCTGGTVANGKAASVLNGGSVVEDTSQTLSMPPIVNVTLDGTSVRSITVYPQLSNAALQAATAIPVNTGAPVAEGTFQTGETVTVTSGTWGGSPTSFAYQWIDGSQQPISGATANSYVVDADVFAGGLGSVLCQVTAINALGIQVAQSNSLFPA